jgi:hypothetical protein
VADDEPSRIATYSQAGAHQVRRSTGIVRAGWSVWLIFGFFETISGRFLESEGFARFDSLVRNYPPAVYGRSPVTGALFLFSVS